MQSHETEPEGEAAPPDETLIVIRRAVDLLFRPGDVVEVRVPKAGRYRTISGYFSDFGELVSAVARLEQKKWPGTLLDAESRQPGAGCTGKRETQAVRGGDYIRRRHPVPPLAAGRLGSSAAHRNLQ